MASLRPTRPALSARYDQRRQDVLDGAAAVFAARGYDQTSVHELAGELNMAAGALYHYFSGKEELLIAICDQLMDPLLADAEALVAEGGEPETLLRAVLRLWVTQVVERRANMLVFQQERHVIEEGGQWREVRLRRKRFERLVAALLENLPGAPADRRLALAALLGMVNHTAQWFRPRGRLSAEAIADGYCDLLLDGGERR